jgi:hypothetical protein
MYFLIDNNQIVGTSDQAQDSNLPNGFSCILGPDLPIELLYFDGKEIVQKPPQPSLFHIWGASNSWMLPQKTEMPKIPISRWTKFLLSVIATATYEKIKTYLNQNSATEYTVLVALLNNSDIPDDKREQLLKNTLRRIKEQMKNSNSPLSSHDVATINNLLRDELGVSWNISG